jgi:prevent-host-death family protein
MNRRLAALPDIADATDFSASAAKAKLGELIDLVAAGGLATITRRGRQRFALLKIETVEALVTAARERELEELGARYDELVARMQTPDAQATVDSLFSVTGEELGMAVAKAAASAAKVAEAAGSAAIVAAADELPRRRLKVAARNVAARSTPKTRKASR